MPIMTICSTCQGVMSQANKRLRDDPDHLARVNEFLAEEGLEYKGSANPKHLLWIILEEIGLEKLKSLVTHPLTHLRVAPFYGCYILRPTDALGFDENPQRQTSLEEVIAAVGGQVVDFPVRPAAAVSPSSPSTNETRWPWWPSTHPRPPTWGLTPW